MYKINCIMQEEDSSQKSPFIFLALFLAIVACGGVLYLYTEIKGFKTQIMRTEGFVGGVGASSQGIFDIRVLSGTVKDVQGDVIILGITKVSVVTLVSYDEAKVTLTKNTEYILYDAAGFKIAENPFAKGQKVSKDQLLSLLKKGEALTVESSDNVVTKNIFDAKTISFIKIAAPPVIKNE